MQNRFRGKRCSCLIYRRISLKNMMIKLLNLILKLKPSIEERCIFIMAGKIKNRGR